MIITFTLAQEKMEYTKMFGFAVGLSSMIVGLALILEHSDTLEIGYGTIGENVCWIKNVEGRLYLFIVPTYAILFITLVFLILIVASIKRNMAATGNNML